MTKIISSLKFLSLVLLPFQGRTKTLYKILDDSQSLCESKSYLNLGYWGFGAQNLDSACQDLAELMARKAQLKNGDEILDVGFGYADQDLYWNEKYQPYKIVGLNISPEQVQKAKIKIDELGLQNKIDLYQGDATKVNFAQSKFDVVFALECAFHFRSREKFMKEAFRVLKPEGRLVMVDLIAVDRKLAFKDRVAEYIGRSFWQIPKENMYPARVCREKLEKCGFEKVELKSIWHDVYPKYVEYASKRLQDPKVLSRLNPIFRSMLKASFRARRKLDPESMDYVLISAQKPRH